MEMTEMVVPAMVCGLRTSIAGSSTVERSMRASAQPVYRFDLLPHTMG